MKLGVVMLPTTSALRKLRLEDLSKTLSQRKRRKEGKETEDTEAR